MANTYQIADEPSPNRYAEWVSSTHWIFLATMLGGSWIGLPWFVFNGYAVGSATRKKEIRAAILSPVLALVFALVAFHAIPALGLEGGRGSQEFAEVLGLPVRGYAYAAACIIAIKLWFVYRLQWLQSKSIAIHESYGGVLKNAAPVMVAAFLLRPFVLNAAAKVSIYLWVVVL